MLTTLTIICVSDGDLGHNETRIYDSPEKAMDAVRDEIEMLSKPNELLYDLYDDKGNYSQRYDIINNLGDILYEDYGNVSISYRDGDYTSSINFILRRQHDVK